MRRASAAVSSARNRSTLPAASERRTEATSATAPDSLASCRWSATAWTTSADTPAPSVIVVPSRAASTSHSAPAVRRVITTFGAVRSCGFRDGWRLALVGTEGGGLPSAAAAAFAPRAADARSSGAYGRVSRVPLRVTLTLMYSGPSASGSPTLTTAPVPPPRRRTRGVLPRSSWARRSATSASVRAGWAGRAGGMSNPYPVAAAALGESTGVHRSWRIASGAAELRADRGALLRGRHGRGEDVNVVGAIVPSSVDEERRGARYSAEAGGVEIFGDARGVD